VLTNKTVIGDVVVGTVNPAELLKRRQNFRSMTPKERNALRASIVKYGFKSFILVRERADGFEIIDGHHRTSIAGELGIAQIPAVVLGPDQDAGAVDLAMLSFNVHAQPVADQMFAFLKEIAESGTSSTEIAALTGMDDTFVTALLDAAVASPTPIETSPDPAPRPDLPATSESKPATAPQDKSTYLEFFKSRYGVTSTSEATQRAMAELYEMLVLGD
jgi:ParB-like chromosome segregation protein Spo0J